MSRMQGLMIPAPGGGEASATKFGDVNDTQGAHGAEQPVRKSEADFVLQSAGIGRTMEHEKGPADATDSGYHENDRQDGEARTKACGETDKNSFVHEAHAIPQRGLFTSLVYKIKSFSNTAFREAWQFKVEFLFADVYESIPAQRERLSPQKARFPKMKQADESLSQRFVRRHASR